MTTLEATFQDALLQALNAPGRATRVWRQNVGTVVRRDDRGRKQGVFHAGPPKGAADLSGIAHGLRLEIECKSARAGWTVEQQRWGDFIRNRGGVYVLVRFDEQLTMAENVVLSIRAIDAAINGAHP